MVLLLHFMICHSKKDRPRTSSCNREQQGVEYGTCPSTCRCAWGAVSTGEVLGESFEDGSMGKLGNGP